MFKRLSVIIFVLIAVLLTSCYKAPKYDITVYITSSGEKYHKERCRYVKNKAIEISLSKALHDGYDSCKVCKPPTQEDLDKLNKKD